MTRLDTALHAFREADQYVTSTALNLAKEVDTAANAPTLTPVTERPAVRDRLSIYRGALAARVAALAALTDAYERDAAEAAAARIAAAEDRLNARPERPAAMEEWRRDRLAQAERNGEVIKITGPNSLLTPGTDS